MAAEYAPVADQRDEKGHWLPGARPPGAKMPAVVGERRERIIAMLREGATLREAAKRENIAHTTILRAMGYGDDELWQAWQQGVKVRRAARAEGVGEVATSVMHRLQDSPNAKAHEIRSLATALAILVDKERDLAALGGSTVGVRFKLADDVFSVEMVAKS